MAVESQLTKHRVIAKRCTPENQYFPQKLWQHFVPELDPLKQLSDAFIFSRGSPSYNRFFQRAVTARRCQDVPLHDGYIERNTGSDPSKSADVVSCSLILKLQFD